MTHKFKIEVSMTSKRALESDKKNRNSLWRDAITKEMQALRIALKSWQMERSHYLATKS